MKKQRDNFLIVFFFSLIVKLFLSYFFPLTGDEAYFITTGKKFYLGYYEHPPLIWWLIFLFSFFGKYTFHFFYYRLFTVFTTFLIGLYIFKFLSADDKIKGYLLSSLFFLSPINIFNFLITNDVPLLLFTFLSGLFFYKGMKSFRKIDFIISGVFFGLSFFKQIFLNFIFFINPLIPFLQKKKKNLWKGFVFFLIATSPFIFINLYWNYTHCWINFLFNLIYRKKKISFKIENLVFFFLSLSFLLTPYSFYLVLKKWKSLFKIEKYRYFFFLSFVPIFFLFILSLVRNVGIHWYISFLPFIFIILKEIEIKEILKAIKFAIYIDTFIIFFISLILLLPPQKFERHKKYPQIIMFLRPHSLCNYLKNYKNEYIFATTGYTESSIMSYYCKNDFIVFGSLSHSGRQYDISFDFKEIDGKSILIFSLEDIETEKYSNFFEEIRKEKIEFEGAKFYLLFCKNFNYKNYRDTILKKTYEKFYKIPEFLPHKGNFFKEKYDF